MGAKATGEYCYSCLHWMLAGYHMVFMKKKWRTIKSKHFGLIEFGSREVAKIIADSMHNYLLYERILKVHLIPPEHVHPKLALEEHKKLLEGTVKRDQIKRKRIKAAGMDYECPEIVGSVQPAPKKIKFDVDGVFHICGLSMIKRSHEDL